MYLWGNEKESGSVFCINGLVLLILFTITQNTNSQIPRCCDYVSGSCAVACNQISLVSLIYSQGADYESNDPRFRNLHAHCTEDLVSFWTCINETLNAVTEGSSWEGRSCCHHAITPVCQATCVTALEDEDIFTGCRKSDEQLLYNCLQKQHESEECCGRSNRPDCVATCHSILREYSSSGSHDVSTRRKLNTVCERESTVISCVLNLTQHSNLQIPNPRRLLECCNLGRNINCQNGCKTALSSSTATEFYIMDTLKQSNCGDPRPDDGMWGCFLQHAAPQGTNPPSNIHHLGIDAPKLHCCHRAIGDSCRKLCYNTYSKEWSGSWSDLDTICLSSPNQTALRSCIEELDEPCEIGCNGLKFCAAFNDRPTGLFRRCNALADEAAAEQYQKWISTGHLSLSETYHLPLRNDSSCDSQKWKTVACALQLKPCHIRNHATQICRSDCVSLLHECVDVDQLHVEDGSDISSICNLISPEQGKPCISLSNYASVPTFTSKLTQITRPCQPNPCNENQFCEVRRTPCNNNNGGSCKSYKCHNGCRLGEATRFVVEIGTWIRVPVGNGGCHRLCQCSTNGIVGQCVQATCEPPSPCWLRRNKIDHGTIFSIDCNLCSCRFGEITCTRNTCHRNALDDHTSDTRLACGCPPFKSPVCGSNGRTYSSICIARCSGLNDAEITIGDCSEQDPCEGVFCGSGRRCVASRRICLHPYAKKCPQYICSPNTCTTKDIHCDIDGFQHENICAVADAGGKLSHTGPCLRTGCSRKGVVCGSDGVTYNSECIVEGRNIPKDYDGPCRHIGGATEFTDCPGVVCTPVPFYCDGVIPPGACCPICGGILRLIYSQTQVLRLAQLTNSQILTVEDIRRKVSALVQTAECQLGAYLSTGNEIVVIIRPRVIPWTQALWLSCITESQRIVTLITQENPILQIDAVLNVFTGAEALEVFSKGVTHTTNYTFLFSLFIICISWNFPQL